VTLKPCIECGRPSRSARCPEHELVNPNRVARSRIYADPRHKRTRRTVLARDGYRCVDCGHHDPSGATLVCDHVHGVLAIPDPFDPSACETRCLRCSGRKDGARSGGTHATPGHRPIFERRQSPALGSNRESPAELVFG
jgi:hypothetical protein